MMESEYKWIHGKMGLERSLGLCSDHTMRSH